MRTTCCVAGGGPAGIMLGYLLARSGVRVTVLEKHADFFRDFRGDTVHPSTLEVMRELDLLDDLLMIPHQRVSAVRGKLGDYPFQAADFSHLPTHAKFIALMPQWDFLNFLTERAQRFPEFELLMEHEAVGLENSRGRIDGVIARTPSGETLHIEADLVVGCDGRHSDVRREAGLEVTEMGVPIDVLWFRISRHSDDPEQVLGLVNYGKALVLINRGDYFQAGMIVRKGSFDEVKARGLEAFQQGILQLAPYFRDRVHELQEWDQIKLLTVQINRLRKWHRPGLLCIGDAAHAMSPAGGVGINLAIQDAVATANLLARALRDGVAPDLAAVQRRREFPTRVTQAVQLNAHKLLAWVFDHPGELEAPWAFRTVVSVPGLRRVLGRAVGMGVRPEHVAGAKRSRRKSIAAIAVGVATGVAVALLVWRKRAKLLNAHQRPQPVRALRAS